MKEHILGELEKTRRTLALIAGDQLLLDEIAAVAETMIVALRGGHKVMLAGNGGSAADAQHIAGEFVSRFLFDRPGLAAMALTTDTSILTAHGKDYGYERLFARQLQALGRPGDVFVAYSTSGRSPNILGALETARDLDIRTVGMTGDRGGPMGDLCDHYLAIPSGETPKIQEGHLVVGHILCGIVEAALFERPS